MNFKQRSFRKFTDKSNLIFHSFFECVSRSFDVISLLEVVFASIQNCFVLKMPEELFRTQITSRDPRYGTIISLCSYSMAGIFLGMFLTLSGVMLTSIDENEENFEINDNLHHHKPLFEKNLNMTSTFDANDKDKNNEGLRHFFGLLLLISGCLLIIISLVLLMLASLLYLRTTTRPPVTNDTDPEPNTVWNYLDSIDNPKPTQPEPLTQPLSV